MFEIIPVGSTIFDWSRFVAGTNHLIGRSPTRELDATGITAGPPNTVIPALAEFARKGSNPLAVYKDSKRILEHLSMSFLVSIEKEILIQIARDGQDLKILSSDPSRNKENCIITATLHAWRENIIYFCRDDAPTESREFFNQIWIAFDKLGFRDIFGNYRRKDLKDRTFALEQKR